MPRRIPDPGAPSVRLLVAALLTCTLAACTQESSAPPPGVPEPAPPSASASQARAPAVDTAAALRRVLDRRARTVLAGDEEAFVSLLTRDRGLRAAEQQYWDNLAQLPVTELGYRLVRGSLVRRGSRVEAVVEVRMRLGQYDDAPELRRVAMTFRNTARGWLLREVGHRGHGAQPWDLLPVVVRTRPGVLGLFDAGSVHAAADLLDSVARGLADVSARFPRDWAGHVVFHAPSDLTFLSTLEHVPGGDPDRVDAVTVPVPGEAAPVAHRVLFHPRVVEAAGPDRDRLVRHELAHVAMGDLGPAVPAWLSEGIAEYVSVQAVPAERRGLTPDAIDATVRGLAGLPDDAGFDGDRSAANYGIAWWACEVIARSWGEPVLWSLLDAYDRADPSERPGMLHRVLGVSERRLARDTARLIRREYLARPSRTP